MPTVTELLRRKGSQVWSVGPTATAYEALQLMAERDIGAVLVVDGERVEGIFSERDYARKVVLRGRSSRTTKVGELMTQAVYYVTPRHTVNECLALMTEKHIRHLPVLEDHRIAGLVSIGDAVKAIMEEQQFTIQHLEQYITGTGVPVGDAGR